MNPLVSTMLLSAAVAGASLTALWLVSVVKRDASIIDPAWGAGFVVIAGSGRAI